MEKSILEMVGGEKYLHHDVNNKVAKEYTTLQERIEQLEKENAELKGLVNQYKASKCGSISLVNRNIIMSDQLNKAKELLREIIDTPVFNQMGYDLYENEGYTELVKEAE